MKKIIVFALVLQAGIAGRVFGQEERRFYGTWCDEPAASLGWQFLNGGNIRAALMIFSNGRCSLGLMQGAFGMSSTQEWEGAFRVNAQNKTLQLIDDFGDAYTYRYVFSETEGDIVLKLKDIDGEITTWYKTKNNAQQ